MRERGREGEGGREPSVKLCGSGRLVREKERGGSEGGKTNDWPSKEGNHQEKGHPPGKGTHIFVCLYVHRYLGTHKQFKHTATYTIHACIDELKEKDFQPKAFANQMRLYKLIGETRTPYRAPALMYTGRCNGRVGRVLGRHNAT